MRLKRINIDEVANILSGRGNPFSKAEPTQPVRISAETYKVLQKIKKANGIKSISHTIDMLVVSTALAQFTGALDDMQDYRIQIKDKILEV